MQHNTPLKLDSEKSLLNVFFPMILKCNVLRIMGEGRKGGRKKGGGKEKYIVQFKKINK